MCPSAKSSGTDHLRVRRFRISMPPPSSTSPASRRARRQHSAPGILPCNSQSAVRPGRASRQKPTNIHEKARGDPLEARHVFGATVGDKDEELVGMRGALEDAERLLQRPAEIRTPCASSGAQIRPGSALVIEPLLSQMTTISAPVSSPPVATHGMPPSRTSASGATTRVELPGDPHPFPVIRITPCPHPS